MVRSIFVPTQNIQQFSNYYLVQLLAKQRVICLLENKPFLDISPALVEQYLTIPVGCQTANETAKFIKSESKDVFASFNRFEQDTVYKEALDILKQYTGSKYEINGVTTSGIMVLIETPETVK